MREDPKKFAALETAWELFEMGEFDAALRLVDDALEVDDRLPEARFMRGSILLAQGDAAGSAVEYERCINADPMFAEALAGLARALFLLGKPDAAIERFESALELVDHPADQAEIRLAITDALYSDGNPEAALDCFRQIQADAFGPVESEIYATLAAELGEFETAKSQLIELIAREPKPHLHHALAMVYEGLGQNVELVVQFLQCRRLDLADSLPPNAPKLQEVEDEVRRLLLAANYPELEGTLVLVEDYPGVEMVSEGFDPWTDVAFEQIDLPKGAAMTRLLVYRRNLAAASRGDSLSWQQLLAKAVETEVLRSRR